MKAFQKLALVSAMTVVSSAYALEAADDATLAAATGQDGITIIVKPGVITDTQATSYGVSSATQNLIDNSSNTTPGVLGYVANDDNKFAGLTIRQVVIHDDDGLYTAPVATTGVPPLTLDNAVLSNSGALVIGGGLSGLDLNGDGDFVDAGEGVAGSPAAINHDRTVVLADGSKPIQIDVDMVGDIDGGGAGGAMLNVKITTPRLAIKTGDIYVADSNAAPQGYITTPGVDTNGDGDYVDAGETAPVFSSAEVNGTTAVNAIKIMSGLELVMGAGVTTIQLGSEAQGAMIKLDTTFVGGLTINNLDVKDAGGAINPTPLGTVVTTGGSLHVGSLSIKDNGGSNLTMMASVDVGSVSTAAFTTGAGSQTESAQNSAAAALGFGNYATVLAFDAGNGNTDVQDQINAGIADNQTTAQGIYNGLVVRVDQMGTLAEGVDLAMNNVRVGDSAAKDIGDIQILGLNLNGSTLVIMGH